MLVRKLFLQASVIIRDLPFTRANPFKSLNSTLVSPYLIRSTVCSLEVNRMRKARIVQVALISCVIAHALAVTTSIEAFAGTVVVVDPAELPPPFAAPQVSSTSMFATATPDTGNSSMNSVSTTSHCYMAEAILGDGVQMGIQEWRAELDTAIQDANQYGYDVEEANSIFYQCYNANNCSGAESSCSSCSAQYSDAISAYNTYANYKQALEDVRSAAPPCEDVSGNFFVEADLNYDVSAKYGVIPTTNTYGGTVAEAKQITLERAVTVLP